MRWTKPCEMPSERQSPRSTKEADTEMDQQTQSRDRQRPEEQAAKAPETRSPERKTRSGPAQLAQAILAGVPLLDMPPARLGELAALVGNQGMGDLLEAQQMFPLEQTQFTLPEAIESRPCPVPELSPLMAAPVQLLSGTESAGRAFDPAGLVY